MTALLLYVWINGAAAGERPCEDIKTACETAGFVKGPAGGGLWKDCIEPIVEGKVPTAKGAKPLPKVDPAVVKACKDKHGMGGAPR